MHFEQNVEWQSQHRYMHVEAAVTPMGQWVMLKNP